MTHPCKHPDIDIMRNACLMVLIIFGLVVPMSVLTQLLTATLWKAFCFCNETQCEGGRQCLTLTYKLRDSPWRCQKQKLNLVFCLSFLLHLLFRSSPYKPGHSAFIISCSVFVIGLMRTHQSAPHTQTLPVFLFWHWET